MYWPEKRNKRHKDWNEIIIFSGDIIMSMENCMESTKTVKLVGEYSKVLR